MAVYRPTINGQSITYDAIGNPLSYRNGMSFTWNGRQMATANLNGTAVTYKYDADGLRNYKKVGNTVHEYEYVGGQLVYEKRGDLKFYYRYNAMGELASIKRINAAGSEYTVYVITNTRGDVEELRLADGSLYARYVYDSWGNVLHVYNGSGVEETNVNALSLQNPFRYRSYYYDTESGLYYLQSRYYDPVTCRFVNADALVNSADVLGFNMYAYCANNPVNYSDPSGLFFKEAWSWIKSKVKKGIEKVGKFLSSASNALGTIVGSLEVAFEKLTASVEKSVKTSLKPNNVGAGTFKKQIKQELNSISKFKSGATKAFKLASVGEAILEVGTEVYSNIVKGSNLQTIVSDAAIDISIVGVSTWAVSAFTTTAIGGMVLAGVIYIFVDVIPIKDDKTFRECLKEGNR